MKVRELMEALAALADDERNCPAVLEVKGKDGTCHRTEAEMLIRFDMRHPLRQHTRREDRVILIAGEVL